MGNRSNKRALFREKALFRWHRYFTRIVKLYGGEGLLCHFSLMEGWTGSAVGDIGSVHGQWHFGFVHNDSQPLDLLHFCSLCLFSTSLSSWVEDYLFVLLFFQGENPFEGHFIDCSVGLLFIFPDLSLSRMHTKMSST